MPVSNNTLSVNKKKRTYHGDISQNSKTVQMALETAGILQSYKTWEKPGSDLRINVKNLMLNGSLLYLFFKKNLSTKTFSKKKFVDCGNCCAV